jgi:hypothetical protein
MFPAENCGDTPLLPAGNRAQGGVADVVFTRELVERSAVLGEESEVRPVMSGAFAGVIFLEAHRLAGQCAPRVATPTSREIPRPKLHVADRGKFDQLDWTTVLDVAESEELKKAEQEIASRTASIAHLEQQVVKITNPLIDTPSTSLKKKLIAAEEQAENEKTSLTAAQEKLDRLRQQHRDLLDESVVYSKLATAKDVETRARLREEIRRKVRRIEVSFMPQFVWCVITFVNDATTQWTCDMEGNLTLHDSPV